MARVMPEPSENPASAVAANPRIYCKGCGYALVGLESCKCPGWGWGFDLGDLRTFARRRPRGWVWRWGRRVLAVVLLLMLAAGAGLFWLWRGWQAEQGTIGRIHTFGYRVEVKPIGPERLRWVLGERWGYLMERVDVAGIGPLEAVETAQLDFRYFSRIEALKLFDCELNNSDLGRLAGLRTLQSLYLIELRIEKPDLAFLDKLPALSKLDLRGEWVAEAGFEHIGRLQHLKVLSLGDTSMSDADLRLLQGLSSLERLDLRSNPISGAGLEHLKGLKSLRILLIDMSPIGSSDVAKLKQAIPGLKIDDWDAGGPW